MLPPKQQAMERWERVRECFERAVSRAAAERAEYLDSECAYDPALRAEVEELLKEHDRKTAALATPAGPAVSSAPGLEKGALVGGRFEIVGELGSGGMGEVYEARDRALGEVVALKRVRAELLYDPKVRERFRHEILNGRRVTHRNICRIHDLVHDDSSQDGPLAFTMELLDGETLADMLEREGRLTIELLLPLVQQMAAGLTALHESNIVHRDLKPANVMLIDDGGEAPCVKITDFGLARRDVPEGGLTSLSGSQDLIGTPTYMAPEQLTGERDKIGPATDVYALGLMLYEAATGERPFPGKTWPEHVYEKLNERPKEPREHVPDIPDAWNNTILHCLQVEPAGRPQTPQEVLEQLEGVREAPAPPKPNWFTWANTKFRWAAVATLGTFLALSTQIDRLFTTDGPQQLSVAVLPFGVMGDDAELPAFADGLMATITRRLTQFEGMNDNLVVMAPGTVLSHGIADPVDAGEKLGVGLAIDGDLQASGDRLALTLTLVDTVNGHQLDTKVVDGSRTNTVAFLDGSVRGIANMLDLRMQPQHVGPESAVAPAVPGWYEYYLQGVGYLERSDRPGNLAAAVQLFERANTLNPKSVEPHAGLATAYWLQYLDQRDGSLARDAMAAAEHALTLDENSRSALTAMGRILVGTNQDDRALEVLARAIELDRRDGEAHLLYAQTLARANRDEEAEASFRKAASLRPFDWSIFKQYGIFLLGHSRYQDAIVQLRTVVDLSPDNAQGWSNLGVALYAAERLDEAQVAFERSLAIDENRGSALSNLGTLAFEKGEYATAADYYRRAIEERPNEFKLWGNLGAAYYWGSDSRYGEAYNQAIALVDQELELKPGSRELYSHLALYNADLGRTQDALEALQRAVEGPGQLSANQSMRLAQASEVLGRRSEAINFLRRALEAGYSAKKLPRMPILAALIESDEWRRLWVVPDGG